MKTSNLIFILATVALILGGSGKYGVLAVAFIVVGLIAIGAFLVVNGY